MNRPMLQIVQTNTPVSNQSEDIVRTGGVSSDVFYHEQDNLPASNLEPALNATETPINIEDLYPVAEARSNIFDTALGLLREGIDSLIEAVSASEDGDILKLDDAVMRTKGLMPELFCCRAIGDGYGALINAVSNALRNFDPTNSELTQVLSMKVALMKLRTAPYMSFDAATDIILQIEDSGLDIDPPVFNDLASVLVQ